MGALGWPRPCGITSSGRSFRWARGELGEQVLHSLVDVVDDGSDGLDGAPRRVGQVPVEVVLAWVVGAGVAAAHGDDHVGGSRAVIGEGLGVVAGRVQPAFW